MGPRWQRLDCLLQGSPVSCACLAQWGKRWDQITVFTSPAEVSRGGHPALLTGCHLAGLLQCRKHSQITTRECGAGREMRGI